MAIQVVHKAKAAKIYKGIFWLSSAFEGTLCAGINGVARELRLIKDAATDFKTVHDLVRQEFNAQDHWLMVLDNVDDVDMIQRFLPDQKGMRHVLITSRYREAHTKLNGIPIHLDALKEDEARALFSKTYLMESPIQDMPEGVPVSRLMNELALCL